MDNNNEKTEEIKKEFQRLAMKITGDNQETNDDNENKYRVNNTINMAIKALNELQDLSLKTKNISLPSSIDQLDVPREFWCPVSKGIMNDPVILTSGKTYDRPFIQKWLQDVHQTCPQTREVLSHAVLTPNQLIRELIQKWFKDHGIQLPSPVSDLTDEVTPVLDRDHLAELLNKLSSSTLSEQKQAAKEIRLLTKTTPSVRPYFSEITDAISQLLGPLSQSENINDHPDLQLDLVTVLLNISIHESNKQMVAEHPRVIPLLVESLIHGTIDTRSNAAAALFTLSSLNSNKILIGNAYALKPLIDLLDKGGDNSQAMNDAANAIFSLCVAIENRGRAVGGGAVRVILEKIRNGVSVKELLSIMVLLATHEAGVEELVELGAVKCLLGVIRENISEPNMDNGIAILHSICRKNRAVLMEINEDDKANGTISMVAEQGTSRAKTKANSILDRIRRITATNLATTP